MQKYLPHRADSISIENDLRCLTKITIILEIAPHNACDILIQNTNLRSLELDASGIENPISSIRKVLTNTNLRTFQIYNASLNTGDFTHTYAVHIQHLCFRLCRVSLQDLLKLTQLQSLKLYGVKLISINPQEIEEPKKDGVCFQRLEKLILVSVPAVAGKWIVRSCPRPRLLRIDTDLLEHIQYTDHLECLILESVVRCDSTYATITLLPNLLRSCSRLQVLVLSETPTVDTLRSIVEREESLRSLRVIHPSVEGLILFEKIQQRCLFAEIVCLSTAFGNSDPNLLRQQQERCAFLQILPPIMQIYELPLDIRVHIALWCADNKKLMRLDRELDVFIRFVNIHLRAIETSTYGVRIFESGHWYLSERVFVPCRPYRYRIEYKNSV